MDEINDKIEQDYDENIFNLLHDKNVYKNSKSIHNKIELLKQILIKHNIETYKHDSIINDIIDIAIPAGLKGVKRGNLFNRVIKNEINSYDLQKNRFHVAFEEKNNLHPTDEIPDWFIEEYTTGKILIGFNQIDLWTGGAQLNRASKYILSDNDTENVKFLSVIAARPKPFRNENSKCFKIFQKGLESDRICYITTLKKKIYQYFDYKEVGLYRNPIDKFYTKSDVARVCMEYVIKHVSISRDHDWIIEPSAGNGSFLPFIKEAVLHFRFMDISPRSEEIIQQDFFDFHPEKTNDGKIHVVGNPPFGRQSSMAFQFLKQSMGFADSVSFILPRSFRKQSFQEKIHPFFHLVFEIDICDNAFLIGDIEYNVPCIFQIWIKKEVERPRPPRLEPTFFRFVKKHECPDIAFRRVGIYAGRISKEIENKSEESHYFIKFTNNEDLQTNMKKFDIHYEFNNHTGPPSISKQELLSYLQ